MRTLTFLAVLWLVGFVAASAFGDGCAHAGVYVQTADGAPAAKYSRWAKLMRVDEPDAVVTVHEVAGDATLEAECGSATATACMVPQRDPNRFTIHVQRQDDVREQRLAFWHELGHVFDATMLDDDDRGELRARMPDAADLEWWSADYELSPAETFARTYAACAALGPSLPRGASAWATWSGVVATTIDRHAFACNLIRRRSLYL